MKDIVVNGHHYTWYYEERDGSHWYQAKMPKALSHPFVNLTVDELRSRHGLAV